MDKKNVDEDFMLTMVGSKAPLSSPHNIKQLSYLAENGVKISTKSNIVRHLPT